MGDCQFERNGMNYRFCEDSPSQCDVRLFDSDWLSAQGLIQKTISHGRNRVDIFSHRQSTLVCRHYYRGGAMRRILMDQYLWTGLKHTRAWKEFDVLLRLQSLNLPAPEPYACRIIRNSFSYRACLITRYIPSTETLAETLRRREVSNQQWFDIGRCVRKFHDVGLHHSDLNANNILLDDQNQVYLIDFDKASFLPVQSKKWKQRNLERLQRSIVKCQTRSETFYYDPTSWGQLRDGYSSVG